MGAYEGVAGEESRALNPEEEYLFWSEGVDQMMGGEPIQAATPGSAAGSRYSGDPSF
ncbi:hypothetical protein F2Q69_00058770 [Brassica cretica]|uniref:Uncharacterized protein n=1 Tax=Brassica cretica TaxID=69181 RepID=A0A8S9RNK1_BRACR|nr:hypothetical protein F2Q69_00058770 [Brassica cretica]